MSIENKPFAMAFALACGDVQADFLNTAGATLRRATSNGTGDFDMQCCFIVNALNQDGQNFILRLAEFMQSDLNKGGGI